MSNSNVTPNADSGATFRDWVTAAYVDAVENNGDDDSWWAGYAAALRAVLDRLEAPPNNGSEA